MITKPRIVIDAARVRALAADGCSQAQIAQNLGISDDTLQARKKDTPAIAEALEEGHAAAVVRVENTLFQMAVSGKCIAATIYWLKCRCPEKWNDRQQIDLTAGGTPVQIQIIDDLKD